MCPTPKYEADEKSPVVLFNQTPQMASPDYVYKNIAFEKSSTHFHIMPHPEPHLERRKRILAKYPQIRTLFTKDSRTLLITLFLVFTQLFLANYVQDKGIWVFLGVMYIVGATLNHACQILIHDLTHYTAYDSFLANKVNAIFVNIPIVVPSAISFSRYHRDHHQNLGNPDFDYDLPSVIGNKTGMKFLFVFFMSFFYSLRPFFKKPKSPSKEEIFNIFVILASDYLVYTCFGGKALLYLIGSTFFSIGMHPVAGNFIGEHYEFVKGLETYDYIGILNIPNLNLGYHIEHHDFPEIPWTLLPQARKIAPEFYENIPIHTSYVRVIYEFIFNKNLGLFSRIDNSIQRVKEGIADNSTKSTKTQKVEDEKNK